MQYPLPDIEEFIDDELTEADFKVALTKLHAYLTEAIGVNAENVAATINITATGTGNAVTGISANGSNLTITKGATFVPQTRTIAGHALNEDITLTAADISGAVSNNMGVLGVGMVVIASYSYGTTPTGTTKTIDTTTPVSGSALKITSDEEYATGGSSSSALPVHTTSTRASSLPGTWRYIGSLKTVGLTASSMSQSQLGFVGYWQRIS